MNLNTQEAKEAGCHNILALRGDPPRGEAQWTAIEGGFEHAVDLIRYIRKHYGDYFDIAVAGFPEGHPQGTSRAEEMQFLKAKVDAGASCIITQVRRDLLSQSLRPILTFLCRCSTTWTSSSLGYMTSEKLASPLPSFLASCQFKVTHPFSVQLRFPKPLFPNRFTTPLSPSRMTTSSFEKLVRPWLPIYAEASWIAVLAFIRFTSIP